MIIICLLVGGRCRIQSEEVRLVEGLIHGTPRGVCMPTGVHSHTTRRRALYDCNISVRLFAETSYMTSPKHHGPDFSVAKNQTPW